MARFVAKYEKYRHGVQSGRATTLVDGQQHIIEKHISAVFRKGMGFLTEDEIQFGIQNLNHTGLPIDNNTSTLVSPRHRLGGFDSVLAQAENRWTDEERELVEKTLRESPYRGRDFIEIPAAPVLKPWATYDTTPAKEIASVAKTVGVPLEDVLAYETANRNDKTVVFLIEDAIANASDEEKEEAPVVIEA